MKDAVATMGTILTDDVGGRDAVHVAVIAVTAKHRLNPGEHVHIDWDGMEQTVITAFAEDSEGAIGIVDPFLAKSVEGGQRFWLYLYPRTITGLSHRWTHPAFPDDRPGTSYTAPSQKLTSEQWLRSFVKSADCPDYETVIAAAVSDYRVNLGDDCSIENDGEYLHFRGRDAHGDIPPEFWDHVEVVTGRKISKRAKYFSCSC